MVRVGRTTAAELEFCRARAGLGEGPRLFREAEKPLADPPGVDAEGA